VIYQHPLGYLLGLEGIALLRAYAGEHDREFTERRLAAVQALLDHADELGGGAPAYPISTAEGYRTWAPSYDSPGNQLIDIEGPIVRGILDRLPVGDALDAACGTGRHAQYLAELGHRVVGVDASAEMLTVARGKLPGADLREGSLEDLPLPDRSVGLVVCTLALTHVTDLGAAFAELVRVLRPGGHLVVSNSCGLLDGVGTPMVNAAPDGRQAYLPYQPWRTGDYLRAAVPLGLVVRACEEPMRPDPMVRPDGIPTADDGDALPAYDPAEPGDISSLHRFAVEATNAAYRQVPVALVWQFQLPDG
jgi:SAM-dependent methyltransferase